MFVAVIIAAGGRGTRLGADVPKQWLTVGDRTILARSVAAFDTHPRVNEIVIVLPEGHLAEVPPTIKPGRVVTGGRAAAGFGRAAGSPRSHGPPTSSSCTTRRGPSSKPD